MATMDATSELQLSSNKLFLGTYIQYKKLGLINIKNVHNVITFAFECITFGTFGRDQEPLEGLYPGYIISTSNTTTLIAIT